MHPGPALWELSDQWSGHSQSSCQAASGSQERVDQDSIWWEGPSEQPGSKLQQKIYLVPDLLTCQAEGHE